MTERTRPASPVAIAAATIHDPSGRLTHALPERSPDESCPSEEAHRLLGRKGLLFKEPATRLALCAVHRALELPRGPAPRGDAPDPRTAVVAASNLGNVQTVCDVAREARDRGARAVSPMQAPNASSNVVASTVARWFGFGGPNLMVCSGAVAGLDAVAIGQLLIRAGRADRVVVVGAEPADDVAVALAGSPLLEAAACVILRRAGGDNQIVVDRVRAEPPHQSLPTIGPVGGGCRLDPTLKAGNAYGAQGVINVALAASWAGRPAPRSMTQVAVTCGSDIDGWRSTRVSLARRVPACD